MDTNGGYPVKGAAPLMRGGIFQHRFGKHFMQRLYFRRRQDEVDLGLTCRLRVFKEKKMVTSHRTILGCSGRIPRCRLHRATGPGRLRRFLCSLPNNKSKRMDEFQR